MKEPDQDTIFKREDFGEIKRGRGGEREGWYFVIIMQDD